MNNTNAKVTLTTSQLKERLDKMLLICEARDKEAARKGAEQVTHLEEEEAKLKPLLDYIESDEWKSVAPTLYYKEEYTEPTYLTRLFGGTGRYTNVLCEEEVIESAINHLRDKVPDDVVVISEYVAGRVSYEITTKVTVWRDLTITTDVGVPYRSRRYTKSLPIKQLQYMVSLGTDIEVDVEWLRKIDEIDK